MNEKLKESLYRILDEKVSECSWLDYKEFPYASDFAKFIKLLNGFLNSTDSYQKDKFIIIGVSDDKVVKGLTPSMPMQDDKIYQSMADKISPRPSIETGTFIYNRDGKDFELGYIYIPSAMNDDRVYTINKDFPDESIYINDIRNGNRKKCRVYASTAWIRRGSVNQLLTEEDRRIIYKQNDINNRSVAINPSDLDLENKIIKMLILVGAWDESNVNEKEIISKLIDLPYKDIVAYLRRTLTEETSPFQFKEDKWIVKDRFNLMKLYAKKYFNEEMISFQDMAIEVLSSYNPKFDVSSEKRLTLNATPKFSGIIQSAVSEGLAMISSIINNFENCNKTVNNLTYKVIGEIMSIDNWKLWATLDSSFPFLAEAEPNLFLSKIQEKIKNSPEMIKDLVSETDSYITHNYYTAGLYSSLQLIAWQDRYLVITCMTLAKLSEYDKKAKDIIIGILLPWFPQTKASIDTRKAAIKNIFKEFPLLGKEVLIELMPNKRTIASPSYKPKWNNILAESKENVSKTDYLIQIEMYLDMLLDISALNKKILGEIIDLLDDVPKSMFNRIIGALKENSTINLSDERKYFLWDNLENFITRHERFPDSNWSLPINYLKEVKETSELLKPKDPFVYNRRYFKNNIWTLQDERTSFSEFEKELFNERIKILKTIYRNDLKNIIKFVKKVEDPYSVGICSANIINKEEGIIIVSFLDSRNKNLSLFAKGVIYKNSTEQGETWLKKINLDKLSNKLKIELFIILPQTATVFGMLSKYLGDNENSYWRKVKVNPPEKDVDLNYLLEKLLKVNRAEAAIEVMGYALSSKQEYDRNLAINALKQFLDLKIRINSFIAHNIQGVIKKLQSEENNTSCTELFDIEWAYLVLLDGVEGRPLTIEKELSKNPKIYLDILEMAYKPENIKKEDYDFPDNKMVTNAYRLLHQWKIPPGLNEKGIIEKELLQKWYEEMKSLCKESNRLEAGLFNFGRVLYYSPVDKSGLWIDKNIASILNSETSEIIRRGFGQENYNSLGVVNIDEQGKIYDDTADIYENKAKAIEAAGYSRVAVTMRELSDSFREQAKRIRLSYFTHTD